MDSQQIKKRAWMPNSPRSLQSPETKDIIAPSGSDGAINFKRKIKTRKIWLKNEKNAS